VSVSNNLYLLKENKIDECAENGCQILKSYRAQFAQSVRKAGHFLLLFM
jgi:hypothetical protein